jgi:EmrB/QacA subfamily drug resistance transporter
MTGIDMRIVIVGLPAVAASLRTDLETMLWVTQGYQFAMTIGLLVIGRITDMVGRVKIYNAGFALFTFGSALCGFSQSGAQLVAFRLIQGVGAAMLLTNSIALITDATPITELGLAIGVNQIAFRAGAFLGLTLGGALIQLVGWRSIFLLNIPIGLFGTLWAHVRLKEVAKINRDEPFDTKGFVTFTIGLTALLLATTYITMDPSAFSLAIGLLVISGVAFMLFAVIEGRVRHPLLDLSLFTNRLFAAGNLSLLFNALSMGALLLVASLYLQIVKGLSPLEAGMMFLPLEATFLIVGPISGKLSDRYGARGLSTLGMAISTFALFWMSHLSAESQYLEIATMLSIVGVGLGLFAAPNMSSIMGSVPPERRGVASGVRATLFNAGSVVSIGLVAVALTTELSYGTASAIISGSELEIASAERIAFLAGLRKVFLLTAIMCMIGTATSAMRGPKPEYPGSLAEPSLIMGA